MTSNIFDDFISSIDVVSFVESNLTISGDPYQITNCGRDYLHEILRYASTGILQKGGKPVVILKSRQVEMTTTCAALDLYFMCTGKANTFLHTFPLWGQVQRFTEKALADMIDTSKDNYIKNKLKKDGANKQKQRDFVNNNTLYTDSTGLTGSRLRNISLDYIFFDEFQDITRQAFDNTMEAASHSKIKTKYGMIFPPHFILGTPLNSGSIYEKMWEKSSRRDYHLKCIHCGEYFKLFYKPTSSRSPADVNTNLVSGFIVKHMDEFGHGCGQVMDKREKAMREGKWISDKPEDETIYRGYYVPQMLIPTISKEELDHKLITKTPRSFTNEVLGEFYTGIDTTIDYQDVVKYTTTEPDTLDWRMVGSVTDGRKCFMGVDYGGNTALEGEGSRGSFTAITILSVVPATGQLKLEFTERLSTNDSDETEERITELMRKFNVAQTIGDMGYGKTEFQHLNRIHGSKYTACDWRNQKKEFVYSKDQDYLTANKHYVHEDFYDQLMHYKFCIPGAEEDRIDWMWEHISNIEIGTREVGGAVQKIFKKKAGRQVDGLASIIYAYTAYMFFKTQGFQIDRNQANNLHGGNMSKPSLLSGSNNQFRSFRDKHKRR